MISNKQKKVLRNIFLLIFIFHGQWLSTEICIHLRWEYGCTIENNYEGGPKLNKHDSCTDLSSIIGTMSQCTYQDKHINNIRIKSNIDHLNTCTYLNIEYG